MIYFLFGEDTYRSRKKLSDIIAVFRARAGSHGHLNITRVDAQDESVAVLEIGQAASLFAVKEMYVIERISQSSPEAEAHVMRHLPSWQKDRNVVVIFWEGDGQDSKRAVFKEIKKRAEKSQEFKGLSEAQVRIWIDREAERLGFRVSREENLIITAKYGNNLWAIAQELGKMQSGWRMREERNIEEKIWGFTDAFLKNRRSALPSLTALVEAGFDGPYLLGALASSLRTIALIRFSLTSKNHNQAIRGLHPYVVKKNTELARSISATALYNAFTELIATDVAVKTGKAPPPLPLIQLVLAKST